MGSHTISSNLNLHPMSPPGQPQDSTYSSLEFYGKMNILLFHWHSQRSIKCTDVIGYNLPKIEKAWGFWHRTAPCRDLRVICCVNSNEIELPWKPYAEKMEWSDRKYSFPYVSPNQIVSAKKLMTVNCLLALYAQHRTSHSKYEQSRAGFALCFSRRLLP